MVQEETNLKTVLKPTYVYFRKAANNSELKSWIEIQIVSYLFLWHKAKGTVALRIMSPWIDGFRKVQGGTEQDHWNK